MKKLIFGGGCLTGIVLTIIVAFILSYANQQPKIAIPGAVFFDEPTEVFPESTFKVQQVVRDNAALVSAGSSSFSSLGTIYLLVNHNNHFYYDDEIINVPAGKKVRQIGIYRYTTSLNLEKTVPVIEILDY